MNKTEIESEEEKAQILVVEDNSLVRDVLQNLLAAEEFTVITSENGQAALNALQTCQPDLIICDVMMPEMDGYQFQSSLKAQKQNLDTPFIFLTALGESKDKQRGIASGADAYVVKPFDPQELITLIKSRLQRANEVQDYYQQQEQRFSSEVIRQISHEFRTPLVAITTGTEFLNTSQDKLSAVQIKKLLSNISSGGKRLEKLVNNFITLQQINSGLAARNFDQQKRVVSLKIYLEQYLDQQNYCLADQGISTQLLLDPSLGNCGVVISSLQFGQIVDRIFENALKFAPEGKLIVFKLTACSENHCRLTIIDQGSGFAQTDLSELQQVFRQHDRVYHEQQGCGLGLNLAQQLLTFLGSRLELDNRTEGSGAEVGFKLQLASED